MTAPMRGFDVDLGTTATRWVGFASDAARILAVALPKRILGTTRRPEVVLHAGQHKTGSTSLQAFILRYRAELARHGVHVLRTAQSQAGDHHRLIRPASRGIRWKARQGLIGAEMVAAHPLRVLISSETAAEVILAGGGRQLIGELRAAGAGRISLLLYLRSPYALANASYSEVVSGLEFGGPTFPEFLRNWNETAYARYDRFLELAEGDDISLTVRPYHAEARRSMAADVLAALGVDFPFDEEPRLNASLGPVALEAIRHIAHELKPMARERRWLLSERLRAIGRTLAERPFWGMDAGHELLIADAEQRTDDFARAVWGKGWRDVIGEERRPVNSFDPADEDQKLLMEATLRTMRAAAAGG